MRLAQAARKLSITTEDIVDFLEIRGIVIEKDSNTKLDKKALDALYKHFEIEEGEIDLPEEPMEEIEVIDPEVKAEVSSDSSDKLEEEVEEKEMPVDNEDDQAEAAEKNHDLPEANKKAFKTVEQLLEENETDLEGDLVIKAPKVELKGLNVLGKIDLPEPKPKPEKKEPDEAKIEANRSHSKARRGRPGSKKQKRELSPAEVRKRKEQREARQRERIEKEKKEKREQFYQEKILRPKQLEQKKVSKKKKRVSEEEIQIQKPKPKTALGRFWRWLNT